MSRKTDSIINEMLQRAGITEPPVPVEDLAVNLGIQVVRSRSSGGESGFTLRNSNVVTIGINQNTSAKRQRFTIAHELGHYFLHEGKPLIVDKSIRVSFRDDVSSMATETEEIQANAFAADLLMPSGWVRDCTRDLVESVRNRDDLIARLASRFNVSEEAMTYRLINLGIASA